MRPSVRTLAPAAVAVLALMPTAAGRDHAPEPPRGAALAGLAAPAPAAPIARERIYMVMTDRYANGDPSNDRGGLTGGRNRTGYDPTSPAYFHGGDFKGLTGSCGNPVDGLQRIEDLGFNAIWVTPPVVNEVSQGDSAGYHGYWGLDFTNVDPHLGTNQDFGDFVSCAHRLGMKVIMDVVVNHTGDIVQLTGGSAYGDAPYRDCHGNVFNPASYIGTSAFPCLAARSMPRVPFVYAPLAHLKKPDWLNDPLNYHDRGDIDWSSCSETCFEQGDFYGLDDLFTEKPSVERGLAQIYAGWVLRYKVDGFRVDTARHVNAGFFRLWVPQILAAARAAGVPGFQIFGEVAVNDAIELSTFVRERGLPNVLDFPFQDAVAGYASGGSSAVAIDNRLQDDDYFRGPDGRDPTPATFLGNHDMGRAALQIAQHGDPSGEALLERVLLGYDLLYLLRGAPVVYYGDEVGMIGTGGDQQARQDLFPTQVGEWKTQPRLGGRPIGDGSSFEVTNSPIETRLRELAAIREANPGLATGSTIVRLVKGRLLAVSRIDAAARREHVAVFNSGSTTARVTVATATPAATWLPLLGTSASSTSDHDGKLTISVPPVSTVLVRADAEVLVKPPSAPRLTIRPDDLSSMWQVHATVEGSQPVSVAFAARKPRSARWRRLAVDDSPPYRAFIDPTRYPKNTQLYVVAIARSLDGKVSVSPVAAFRVRAA